MARITWIESYRTICQYSLEITEEQAKLFQEDPDAFFDEVDLDEGDLDWDKSKDEPRHSFKIS